PADRWARMAEAVVTAQPETRILLCGSAPERGVLEEIRQACGTMPVHNIAGDLPIPRLLALLEVAGGMLSVDTGPAHAAAALGCPLVVLFGAASPALWRPIGPGQVIAIGGERGASSRVADLQVDDVAAAWRRLHLRAVPAAG
ncbi:MAG TPA: glycosyltransferase family 9 protein, partial [Luteimonas sp.]|nr:glycosyltransferase family 9 protein [Luteimonas sp.]